MKRIMMFSLLLLFISSSVQALSWAYPFVVWKGNVYEVKEDELIEESEVGKRIGKVKTQADDMTGSYYGDASNFYLKGTEYYEIKGTSTSTAIAVKDKDQWIKAVYQHKARFHIMNVLTNLYFWSAVVIAALILLRIYFRNRANRY